MDKEGKRITRKYKGEKIKYKLLLRAYKIHRCYDCDKKLCYRGKKHPSPAQYLRNGKPICAWCENDRFHSYQGYREQEDLDEALEEERLEREGK